jgi:Glycosyltransferase family 10 (fucosyltransferase) C-term
VSHTTFVFDVDIPPFLANRVFDTDHARQYPGAEALAALGASMRDAGLEPVTADVYLDGPNAGRPAVCLSNETTRFTDDLLSFNSVVPVACMSLESPIVAIDFYRKIQEVSARYRHVFLWGGMRDRASGGATFHEIAWPYPDLHPADPSTGWAERRFLALVNSNKRIFVPSQRLVQLHHPVHSARTLVGAARLSRLRQSEPWLASELYKDRLDAIRHFSHAADFDLFGRGWSDTSTLSSVEASAVARSYRGEVPVFDKVSTLANYRFALCFENTAFPGYVTEKIFDCFVAGCIPISHGAPDIKDLVPASSFIDARDFRDFAGMESFLRTLKPEIAREYVAAAADFMSSKRAERFTQGHFVREVSNVLLQAAGQAAMRP